MHLNFVQAELVSCFITGQHFHEAQYLQFHPAEAEFPIHVFHTHSPSSPKRKLTLEREKFVLRNLWNHAMRCHRALLGSAVQPAGLQNMFSRMVGLPCMCKPFTILQEQCAICDRENRYENKPSRKTGDAVVAINCQVIQEPAPSSSVKAMALSNFSDGYALVVVPIKLKARRWLTPPQLEWMSQRPIQTGCQILSSQLSRPRII